MYKILGLLFSHLNPNQTKSNPPFFVFLKNNLLQRWLKVGIVTVILLCSLAIYPIQVAHAAAANSSHSEAAQNSTASQKQNSVGIENLPGGVESAVLKDGKNSPQPKKSSKSKMKQLRDELSETSPNTAPIDQKNQKN